VSILSLNGINFGVDDLPEEIPLGGTQALAIRQYPGGGLDVQPLGAYDDPITWGATFMYANALDRAITIDNMRIKGVAIPLVIGRMTRKVIITKFTYTYQNDASVTYNIELQPLTAYASGVTVNGEADTIVAPANNTPAKAAPTPQRTYTVKSGDCLWKIASRYYGDGSQWPKIAKANPKIKNPNLIYPGNVLVIP